MLIIPEKEVPEFKKLLVAFYEDRDDSIYGFMKDKCIKTFRYREFSNATSALKVPDREVSNLLEIRDHYPKYVVTLDELASGNVDGVKIVYLADFLLKNQNL